MVKLMEMLTGKKDTDTIQRNINWIDNQVKNLESTKFMLEQQIATLQKQKQKLKDKLSK